MEIFVCHISFLYNQGLFQGKNALLITNTCTVVTPLYQLQRGSVFQKLLQADLALSGTEARPKIKHHM